MLTTSNRFLRDRATKAIVNLLTGRLRATVRLIDRFADVNDPYVAERVYAVAYGVSMRSHDRDGVGALATAVYDRVFKSGMPAPHILLRDYARGVVERALHLGAAVEVVPERIRPPYKSTWPNIPTEEDVKPLLPDWSKGSHDSRQLEWARNRIGDSIMSDDFGRYVIGTNSSSTARDWLSLTNEEPKWIPPVDPQDQLRSLKDESSTERQLEAWEQFESADRAYSFASIRVGFIFRKSSDDQSSTDGSAPSPPSEEQYEAEIARLSVARSEALAALGSVLTADQVLRLTAILESRRGYHKARQAPHLDLGIIQRYVLWRVFDLGWTTERFGAFDRFSIGQHGRDASKAERIGKKYQWIAYHEILAFISDRFQYREPYREEKGDQAYEGPWQDHLRDIDPSCTIRSLKGGTSWEGHQPAWWGPSPYDSWGDPSRQREWVLNFDNMPKMEDLLTVTNPTDNSVWVNVDGYFNWRQQPPADRESTEVERREIWYVPTAYLIRADEAEAFLKWAETVEFWGRWMPDAPEIYRMFVGEHGWSPASRYFQQEYYGDSGWTNPGNECPVKIRTVALEYLSEGSGFDCSIDDGFKLLLPASDVLNGMGIRWSGVGASFLDARGRLVAQDPAIYGAGPTALLIRADVLEEYLSREGLTIVWAILGEKRVLPEGFGDGPQYAALRMSGAYWLSGGSARGFMKYLLDEPRRHARTEDLTVVKIIRTDG
jgi:hypothetical protein